MKVLSLWSYRIVCEGSPDDIIYVLVLHYATVSEAR